MRLEYLKLFLKVVEAGSISAAARECNLAQPAVSVQLKQLEDDLGVRLMERSVKGIELTDCGERLRRHADAILRHVSQAREEVVNSEGVLSGEVTVAVAKSLVPTLAGEVFWRARKLYPNINLRILDLSQRDSQMLIAARQIDFGLLASASGIDNAVLEPMIAQQLYMVGPGHFIDEIRNGGGMKKVDTESGEDTVNFAQLHKFPLVMGGKENQLRMELENVALKRGYPVNILYEQDAVDVYHEIVRSGPVCTVVPYSAFSHDIGSGALKAMLIVKPTVERVMSFTWKKHVKLSAPATAIKELIASTLCNLIEQANLKARIIRQ